MATWTAEVFVNSRVGRINTEVEAATFQGAKEQIYAKHGDVQQIVNLRQVSSGGSSSSSSGDVGGYLMLGAILFGIWVVVEYWWIVTPIAALVLIGWLYNRFSN
jgi:uncharacterized membrane protein